MISETDDKAAILLVSLSTILGGAETYYTKLASILLRKYRVVALVHSHELAMQMRQLGVEVVEQPSRGGLRRYAAGIVELWQAVRQVKPAVVHLNGAHETYLAPVLRILGVPYYVSRHNPFDTPPLRPRIKFHFLVHQLRSARAIICTQTGILEEMRRVLPHTRTVLIPTWVKDTASPRETRSIDPERVFKLVFVGRLIPEKGILTLLEAIAGLRNVSLAVVGVGPLEDECRSMAAGLPVVFHGFARDVSQYISAADLLVFPSNEGYEALPQVPMEAMAAGVPCLASEIVGVREIYGDEPERATFPPGDVDELRAQIVALRNDPARLSRLSYAGVRVIEGHYTEAAVAEQYLEVFQAV